MPERTNEIEQIRARAILSVHELEALHADPSVEQYADAVLSEVKDFVVDSMTPPPGGPDDAFWQGAQWAYGQVCDALFPPVTVPVWCDEHSEPYCPRHANPPGKASDE